MKERPGLSRKAFFAGLLGLPLLGLGACASGPSVEEVHGEVPEPPPGHGRIFFYRTEVPFLVAIQPDVIVNNRRVGTSVHGAAFYRDALPGSYEVFVSSDPDTVLAFTVAEGQTVFVKTVADVEIIGSKLTAELVAEEIARVEIADMTLTSGLEEEN